MNMKMKISLVLIIVIALAGMLWSISLILKPRPVRFIDLTSLNRPNEIARLSIIRLKEELKPFNILLVGGEQNPYSENIKQSLIAYLFQYIYQDYKILDLSHFKTPEEVVNQLQSYYRWIVIGSTAELNAIQKSAIFLAIEKKFHEKVMSLVISTYDPLSGDCEVETINCLGSKSFKTFRNKKKIGASTAFFLERHRLNQFILFYSLEGH